MGYHLTICETVLYFGIICDIIYNRFLRIKSGEKKIFINTVVARLTLGLKNALLPENSFLDFPKEFLA